MFSTAIWRYVINRVGDKLSHCGTSILVVNYISTFIPQIIASLVIVRSSWITYISSSNMIFDCPAGGVSDSIYQTFLTCLRPSFGLWNTVPNLSQTVFFNQSEVSNYFETWILGAASWRYMVNLCSHLLKTSFIWGDESFWSRCSKFFLLSQAKAQSNLLDPEQKKSRNNDPFWRYIFTEISRN